MTKPGAPEGAREINDDEAELFIGAARRFEPYLKPMEWLHDPAGDTEADLTVETDPEEEMPVVIGDGEDEVAVETDETEANFSLTGVLVNIQRRVMTFEDGRGRKEEHISWHAIVREELHELPLEDGLEVVLRRRSYAATEGGAIAPDYSEGYEVLNPETGEERPLRSEDHERFLEESRAATTEEERIKAMMDYAARAETKRRDLAQLTGIEDSDDFTPERLKEILRLLAKIRPEEHLIELDS